MNKRALLSLGSVLVLLLLILIPHRGVGKTLAPLYPGQWWYTSVSTVNAEAAADFNGDEIKDLAIAGFYGTDILFGNGNGTFHAPVRISNALARHIALGDFNNDGNTDVVTIGLQPEIILGHGDGNFSEPKILATTASLTPDLR